MQRTRILLSTALLALLAGGGWALSRSTLAAAAEPSPAWVTPPAEYTVRRDREIARFEARTREDAYGASDRSRLAGLYLQRARETGDFQDVQRAERLARESLALRSVRNDGALATLASALVNQHRFQEAREVAEQLVALEPEGAGHRARLAEIRMELGEYEAARAAFRALAGQTRNLAVAPRLARWAELEGRSGEAVELLRVALREAESRSDIPREQVAWYRLRLGDVALRSGRLDEAWLEYSAGLDVFPGDHRLLAGMARLHAARGDWDAADRWGEAVLARLLDPGTLILLSDVAAARGDRARADEYAGVLRVAVGGQGQDLHRDWSLFLLDRGEQVPEVLRHAREGLRTRRDIYGHDLLAWALFRSGKPAEARPVMRQALRLGTPDPLLHFHAGMIERALGNHAAAERMLRQALRINPRFHPVHAATARDALDELRARRPWYRRLAA